MAADDERPGPGADPRTLALSDDFVVLGAAWMRRRRLLASVHDVDLGTYASHPAAVGLYAVTIALVSGAGSLMARHARDARLLWPGADQAMTPGDHWWTLPGVLLLAIPLSLLVGGWALLLWLALPLARRA
jgi:hypothetical protein